MLSGGGVRLTFGGYRAGMGMGTYEEIPAHAVEGEHGAGLGRGAVHRGEVRAEPASA